MPGFTGHTIANSFALAGTTVVMASQGWSMQDIVAVDAGILISTLVLSPDMDLFTSRPRGLWGLFGIFWLPYSYFVRHRDQLHLPVLGTAVRWLYTMGILFLFMVLFRFWFRRIGLNVEFSFDGDRDDIIYNLLYLADIFIGATIADTMHFVLDMATHELRTAIPRRSRRQVVKPREPYFDGE